MTVSKEEMLALADKIDTVFERVKCFPENQPDGGYFDLILLRNLAHEASVALRCSQGANSEQRQADVRQDGFAICRAIVENVCVLSAPPAPDSKYERAMHDVGTAIVAKIDALSSQATSEASSGVEPVAEAIQFIGSAYSELCEKFSGVHSDDEMDSVLLRLHAGLKKLGADPLIDYRLTDASPPPSASQASCTPPDHADLGRKDAP